MKLKLASFFKGLIDGTLPELNVVNEFDMWSDTKKKSYIDESFFNIVNYSYENVDYYHELFIDYNYTPSMFTSIEKIKKIPILDKTTILTNYDKLKSNQLSEMRYQERRSGGTTGEPIRALISKNAAAFEVFSYFKGLSWMGLKQEMKMVNLMGGSLGFGKKYSYRDRILSHALNSIFIPAFEIDNNSIINIYEHIKKYKSLCITGYASAIYNFIYLLRKNNLNVTNIDLIITTSEQLIEDWKYFLKDNVSCPIRSYYGAGEINSLGYQQSENGNYRIPNEHVYIESDPDTQELIITQLHNKAQPLLRYVIGDIGVVNNDDYPSEITNLKGRTADMFMRKDGSKVSPIFGTHSILFSRIPVKKYQYVQYSDLIIEFRYQMENGYLSDENQNTIEEIIRYVMKERCNVKFTESNNFVVGNSGKHRICVRLEKKYK